MVRVCRAAMALALLLALASVLAVSGQGRKLPKQPAKPQGRGRLLPARKPAGRKLPKKTYSVRSTDVETGDIFGSAVIQANDVEFLLNGDVMVAVLHNVSMTFSSKDDSCLPNDETDVPACLAEPGLAFANLLGQEGEVVYAVPVNPFAASYDAEAGTLEVHFDAPLNWTGDVHEFALDMPEHIQEVEFATYPYSLKVYSFGVNQGAGLNEDTSGSNETVYETRWSTWGTNGVTCDPNKWESFQLNGWNIRALMRSISYWGWVPEHGAFHQILQEPFCCSLWNKCWHYKRTVDWWGTHCVESRDWFQLVSGENRGYSAMCDPKKPNGG